MPAGGPAAGHVGGREADTARRASTVTSRLGRHLVYNVMSNNIWLDVKLRHRGLVFGSPCMLLPIQHEVVCYDAAR